MAPVLLVMLALLTGLRLNNCEEDNLKSATFSRVAFHHYESPTASGVYQYWLFVSIQFNLFKNR